MAAGSVAVGMVAVGLGGTFGKYSGPGWPQPDSRAALAAPI